MILSRKIRLKPTLEQEQKMWKSSGVARWIYNWTIAKQRDNYKQGLKFISDGLLRKEITCIKKEDEFKWIGEVSNNIAKQAVKDACDAYKSFFKGLANKPKFKSKKRSKPSFYCPNDKLKAKKGFVLIEKVGWIKTSVQVPMDAKYTNPRVSFDGKYWYLTVGIEHEKLNLKLTNEIIGIDLGVKDLAICSNGQVFKNINKTANLKKIEKHLRRLQRSVSRKYEMNKEGNRYIKTSNIIKIEKRIQHLHRRLINIRNNHIHQATNTIVKTKPCRVVMENLNIAGMLKNRHLAKAIAKQKFYEFIRQMKYKCEKYGIEFIQVGRFYPSSKTCSCCGTIKTDLKLSDRVYRCECGLEIDRDLNAAINLANYGKSVE
ncbi:TPA: transposase [Bacillus anthracis]|nr:transposase [Bacillus anthracis]